MAAPRRFTRIREPWPRAGAPRAAAATALLPPMIRYVGEDRFLWATDFPHSDHDADYMRELHELGALLDPACRRGLLGDNAARLYKLT